MEEVEIPSYFLCPISLQIMKDPVTLSTGITYDRDAIERWLLSGDAKCCPMTKQRVPPESELTPNHTLRRLIQAWCTLNTSNGIERFPTPKPPVDRARIAALLDEAKQAPTQMKALKSLKLVVAESERNKKLVESTPGAVEILASIISNSKSSSPRDEYEYEITATDEALHILYSLQLSEQSLIGLIEKNSNFIQALTVTLQRSSYQSRTHALLLLKSIVGVISPSRLIRMGEDLLHEIVNVLRDQISLHATKAALHVLAGVSPWGRNRIKIVNAGAVPVLVDMLLEDSDRRVCEAALVVLDRVCGCAEGRAAVAAQAAGIAVVAKKIIRVSPAASERAVGVLHSVCKYSATAAVLQEMVQVGVVGKLCLVLQSDQCGVKTKEKAREILRLHARVWKASPCLSPQFLAFYPS
ncbi:E3 ubiquitin-protein ligase PUB23-like [Typha latifolia]|uniref:E3 ubiquitin-protein ligase PUB23-like n=1 Tax=Typha latifolia TaxID=4733 RepID=UPI003C2B856A